MYSARPGTPAAALEGQVPAPEKADRLARLQELLNGQQQAFNEAAAGRIMDVLFERPGRRAGQLVGRSPYMQAVHADAGGDCLNRIVGVEIESAGANSLAARLVGPPAGQQARQRDQQNQKGAAA
jgi:tRNA-2-methylthio-N6-dimethylallyladenosine synthase